MLVRYLMLLFVVATLAWAFGFGLLRIVLESRLGWAASVLMFKLISCCKDCCCFSALGISMSMAGLGASVKLDSGSTPMIKGSLLMNGHLSVDVFWRYSWRWCGDMAETSAGVWLFSARWFELSIICDSFLGDYKRWMLKKAANLFVMSYLDKQLCFFFHIFNIEKSLSLTMVLFFVTLSCLSLKRFPFAFLKAIYSLCFIYGKR